VLFFVCVQLPVGIAGTKGVFLENTGGGTKNPTYLYKRKMGAEGHTFFEKITRMENSIRVHI